MANPDRLASLPSPRPAPARIPKWLLALAAAALVLGFAGRYELITLAPKYAYNWDHFENIQMGRTAAEYGLLHAYGAAVAPPDMIPSKDRREIPPIPGYVYSPETQTSTLMCKGSLRQVNYPPLGLAIFWAESSIYWGIHGDLPPEMTRQYNGRTVGFLCPDAAAMWDHLNDNQRDQKLLAVTAPNGALANTRCPITGFALSSPVNTVTWRAVMAIPSILFDLLLAAGVFLLGWELMGPAAGVVAGIVTWLFPPLAMDSSFWGQTDSWFLAPAVLVVWLMLRRKWVAAGIVLAVTALLKPQGMFLGPVVLLGSLIVSEGPTVLSAGIVVKRLVRLAVAGAAGVIVLALPWIIAGGMAWARESYIANFGMYHETTLKAFNVWYLDAWILDAAGSEHPLNCADTIGGVTKDAWGMLLTVAAMAVLAVFAWKRFRDKPALALTLYAGLWLYSTFMWPTKVHERYIVYCIPLLIVAAMVLKRLWPAVLVLAIVGSAELCHTVWLKMPLGAGPTTEQVMAEYYSIPPEKRPPQAQLDSVLEQLPVYRQKIRQGVESQRHWELTLTLLSLLGYAWAVISPFRASRPPPALAKPQPVPPTKRRR